MTLVLTALAGGLGAALRYVVDTVMSRRSTHPWGTMLVNVSGSFGLGFVAGLVEPGGWRTVLGVGLLGGYTTFSTASLEAVLLLGEGRRAAALVHTVGMAAACVAAAFGGLALAA